MERKSILLLWDPLTGAVEIDRGNCSVFDVCGILAMAVHQAGHATCDCSIDIDE